MKKRLAAFTIATLGAIQVVQADVAGFEVGAYQWEPDYSGTFSSDSGGTQGTTIDVKNDLGFTDDSHNIIWFSLEHPVPMLPNIKVVSSDLAAAAESTLERDIVFGGETYSATADVTTNFDMSNTEYVFYYEVLDNWLNLDLGLTLRQYDGEVRLISSNGSNLDSFEELDFTIPLFYVKGRADLPFTGFFVDAEMNVVSYDDDSVSDIAFSLGYESDYGFGARAGYRTFELEVVDDSFNGDLELDGSYISVFYHF